MSTYASELPSEYNWLTTAPTYSGTGVARFLDPELRVEGPVTIVYDEYDREHIELQVERADPEEALGLEFLLRGIRPQCIELIVTTIEGEYRITEVVGNSMKAGPDGIWFQFIPRWAVYDVTTNEAPSYWVLPLFNCLSDWIQRDPLLDQHPLRLSPVPRAHQQAEGNTDGASRPAEQRNSISFEFDGSRGFIEPLPDYEARIALLKGKRAVHLITSIMVGNLNGKSIEEADLDTWFPFDFINLLGLATGTEVGAPWIEFRGAQGQLVRRLHSSLSHPMFRRGRSAISELAHRRTGHLLTVAQSSPLYNTSILRVTLKHVLRGGLDSHDLEGRLTHLFRAFEGLCREYNLSQQNLLTALDLANQSHVKTALQTAATNIRIHAASATQAGDFNQAAALNRIAARAQSSSQSDVNFGLAVIALLQRFDLHDATVLNTHYQTHPRADGRKTWDAVLSFYRGATVHEGYLQGSGGNSDYSEAIALVSHLHDILVRIVLKMLGYQGTYEPSTAKWFHTVRSLDWVTPTTSVAELGYS